MLKTLFYVFIFLKNIIMSKKNIFLLAAWYLAGGLVASLYGKKNPSDFKKDLEDKKAKGEWEFKLMLDNFVETHSNLIEDMKVKILTDENKAMFNQKKDEILAIVDSYKDRWIELIEELKVQGKDYVSKASEELEKLYSEKKQEIEWLKWVAPEKIQEIKNSLKEVFEEIKEKINKKK